MSTRFSFVPPLGPPLIPLYFDCCKCGQYQFDVQCLSCELGKSEHFRCSKCTTYRFWDCCKSKEHEGQFEHRPCSECHHQQCHRCKLWGVNHMPNWAKRKVARSKQEKKERGKRERERRYLEQRDWERRRERERQELERLEREKRERERRKREQHELWLDRALRSHPSSRERTIKRP